MNLPNRMPLLQVRFRTKEEADASAETMSLIIQMLSGTVDIHIHQLPSVTVRDRMLGDGEFVAFAASEFLATPPRRGMPPAKRMTASDVVELQVQWPTQPQIMIDLETLGTIPGCPVLSLGAVEMTPDGLASRFYANFELAPQLAAGLVADPETEAWWAGQSPEARAALEVGEQHPIDALAKFATWLEASGGSPCVWGNGADFDNAIMSVMYARLGIKQPWGFWNNRCYRTLKSRAQGIKLARSGVQHNALVDAEQQARHAIEIMNELDLW